MSIIGTLNTAVSGVSTYAAGIAVNSDNIANTQTVGYKAARDLYTSLGQTTPSAASTGGMAGGTAGGVGALTQRIVDGQGVLLATSQPNDYAISGKGFFPVADQVNTTTGAVPSTASRLLTRAGDFTVDANGFVRNGQGQVLLGTPAGSGAATSLGALVPVRFSAASATTPVGAASSSVTLSSNLPATDAVGSSYTVPASVYDASGDPFTLQLQFTKQATNQWSVQATSVTQDGSPATPITATVGSGSAALSFDPASGQLAQPAGSAALPTIALSNGQSLNLKLNLGPAAGGGLTQIGSSFSAGQVSTDGAAPGVRTGFAITSDGTVQAVMSNGLKVDAYQVPLVTVPNSNGLAAESGTAFAVTASSGAATLGTAGSNGAGTIKGGELEQSTVDLTSQFTDLISNQAAYSANTKVISTADQMYQDVIKLQ